MDNLLGNLMAYKTKMDQRKKSVTLEPNKKILAFKATSDNEVNTNDEEFVS
jgi:hypothetical protein